MDDQTRATKAALDAVYKAMESQPKYETVCAWCAKLKQQDKWVKAEPEQGCIITHTICPECYEKTKNS